MPYLPEKRKIRGKRVRIFSPYPLIQQPGNHAWGWLLIAIIFTVVLGYLGWRVYHLGNTQLVADNRKIERQVEELVDRIERISEERDNLRQQVATLERSAQVDKEASRQLRSNLSKLQAERLELKEELTLLETIATGKTPGTRLNVSDFSVRKLASESRYSYNMTVTLSPEQKKAVSATISIRLSGTGGKGAKELNLLELDKKQSKSLKIKFKHLYMIEGEFGLPDGFKPDLVTIDIKTNNESVESLTRSFPWEAS